MTSREVNNESPTGSINGSAVIFQQTDLASSAFPIMEEIRRQGKLCDITIRVEDSCFSAHRIVLCATIPYFQVIDYSEESPEWEIVILNFS